MIIFSFFTALLPLDCISQEIEGIEEAFEFISQDSEEDENLEMIEFLRINPIVLNEASAREISKIPQISLLTAKNIKAFIKKYPSTNFAQIADSLGLSPYQEILLSNCSVIIKSKIDNSPNLYIRSRSINYLNKTRGINEGIFLGNEYDIYNRIQYRNGYFSSGLLTNKDMGEISYSDFISGFVKFQSNDFKIIAGDYGLEMGLGSIFWRTFGMRKGAEVISPASQFGNGIREYSSSMEINYFRGISSSYEHKNFRISLWYSDLNRAGGIDTISNEVTSVYSTGLFRTELESSKRDIVNEQIIGGDLLFNISNFTFGINTSYFNYSIPINSVSSRYFNGKNGYLSSIYAVFANRFLWLSSEISSDARSNIMFKSNIEANFENVDFAISYRYLPDEFRSPYGYNFGENSNLSNEEGIYFALKYKGIKNLAASFYADYYRTLYKTTILPMPSNGIDMFHESIYKVDNKNLFTLRLRHESKSDKFKDEINSSEILFQKERNSLRAEFRHKYSKYLMFRFRAESAIVSLGDNRNEKGFAGFVESAWTLSKYFRLGGRLSYFSTDSFESAIWQFEYAMQGFMTTTSLYGDGSRAYIFLRISPYDNLNFTLRYTNTSKNRVESLGSSWNEILGNKDNRIYFQLDFNY